MDERLPKKALNWQPPGRQKRGRSHDSWIGQVSGIVAVLGLCTNDTHNKDVWSLGARNPDYGNTLKKKKELGLWQKR